jgi:hypothetical protein
MGNLQSVTDLTRLVQDVQYTTALKGMTEQQKQSYFDSQKQELLGNILNDREGTFQKTFVDATRNNSLQQSLFFYQQRNRDLENVGKALENQNESSIGVARYNNQLATRQYEINEWSYNNKLDTLFVFQILFVTLLLTAGLVYLNKLGFLSTTILGIVVGILLLIVIAVLINRFNYTKRVRDQRYWNRRQFDKKDLPQGSGSSICPPGEELTESEPAPAPAGSPPPNA